MERLYNTIDCDYKTLSPLTLAFIGDAVYDLLIREQLVCKANCPVGKLHKMKVKKVCCKAQSEIMKKLISMLTNEELSIFKRGRNAHINHTPKNADVADYHNATGFETLIGYIYLKGDIKRLRELFELIEKCNLE
ncbi:MAG: ribonuclease III domain-containing protein [Acutalibacteraceae bacterium]